MKTVLECVQQIECGYGHSSSPKSKRNVISCEFLVRLVNMGPTTQYPFQVDAVFARIDENHDGKLTLAEFQEMMEHNKKNTKK